MGTTTEGTMPVLSVQGLRVSYTSGHNTHVALADVSFTVAPGEVVALVGESGSGKSTTAAAIMGFLGGAGRIENGVINLGERGLSALTDQEFDAVRGRQIGFVPQDPAVSLNPMMRIGRQVSEALRVHGIASGQEAVDKAVEILREAGLRDPEAVSRSYPHELSGGMRQRVLIGIAMACRPRVLIADEPTSALDVTVQRHILDQLDRVIEETSVGVLLITHDIGVAAERAHRIIVLHEGVIVEADTAKRVVTAPQHDYTKRLIAAAPSLGSRRLTPSSSPTIDTEKHDVLLRVEGLTKHFRGRGGDIVAAKDLSFSLEPGKTLAIVGESGSGKTTTARMIMRLEPVTSGSIEFNGIDISQLRGERLRALRHKMQFVYQNPYASLDPRMSVEAIIAEPLRAFNTSGRETKVIDLIDRVALPASVRRRRVRELSGGQRQRVAIARALALNPSLIILDEPVSALDVSVQDRVLRLLVDLQAEFGLSYLFITHDLAVVRQIADDVVVMKSGHIVETGTTDQILDNPTHPYTASLLAAIPSGFRETA